MTKENRLQIIKNLFSVDSIDSAEVHTFIDYCIIDELKYAARKALNNRCIEDEVDKVMNAYSFEGYNPSDRVKACINHFINSPEVAAMQHVDFNDYVSYIGEYYDGTPTSEYRKEGIYKIEPIKLG